MYRTLRDAESSKSCIRIDDRARISVRSATTRSFREPHTLPIRSRHDPVISFGTHGAGIALICCQHRAKQICGLFRCRGSDGGAFDVHDLLYVRQRRRFSLVNQDISFTEFDTITAEAFFVLFAYSVRCLSRFQYVRTISISAKHGYFDVVLKRSQESDDVGFGHSASLAPYTSAPFFSTQAIIASTFLKVFRQGVLFMPFAP